MFSRRKPAEVETVKDLALTANDGGRADMYILLQCTFYTYTHKELVVVRMSQVSPE